jgi:hypothetical protein
MENYIDSGRFLIDGENDFNLMLYGSKASRYLKIRADYRDGFECFKIYLDRELVEVVIAPKILKDFANQNNPYKISVGDEIHKIYFKEYLVQNLTVRGENLIYENQRKEIKVYHLDVMQRDYNRYKHTNFNQIETQNFKLH